MNEVEHSDANLFRCGPNYMSSSVSPIRKFV